MAGPNIEDREQSIANHFRGLSQETGELVRDELRVVRGELAEQAKRIGASAGLLGAAGALGAGAFGAATAGLISALGRGRTGRGAVLVAMLYGAGATALALVARDQLRTVAPEAAGAAESVAQDVKAAAGGARAGA